MKKRLLRKRILYGAYKKLKLQRRKSKNKTIFEISQQLHTLKNEIKAERTLSLAEKKQRVLNEMGMLLCFFLVGELATATGHNSKELEKNQEKIIIENEQRLQQMAEEPLQKAYQKRRELRRQLAKIRD